MHRVFRIVILSWLAATLAAQSELDEIKALIGKGEFQQARQRLEPLLLSSERNKAEPHYLMGLVTVQQEDYAKAVSHLRIAAQADPANTAILKLLTKALLLSGERLEVEALLQKATRLSPDDAEVRSLLGRLYQESSRFKEAAPQLERAVELNPSDVSAWTSLAFTWFGLGDPERAAGFFERAVAENERSRKPMAAPHASFATVLLRLGRVSEAETQIRKAAALNPRDATLLEAQRALQARSRLDVNRSMKADIAPPPRFHDVAVQGGLNFRLEHSPTAAKHQIETMAGGVAVLDYDQDGFMDVYFTNGAESPSLRKTSPRHNNRLYRNNGNLTFTDVTACAGVAGAGYTIAAAAADFDNDGYPDLFVAGVDRNLLYHNNRNGTFTDVTVSAGLSLPHPQFSKMWGIHGAWFDYDRDGWLDLLVVNYCQWNPDTQPFCGDTRPGYRSYCHPGKYGPLPNQLFRNKGDGAFADVSLASGISNHLGKGMGAAVADVDGDGWPDLFVANDTEPNFLFRNLGNGQFKEIAIDRGVAFNQFGSPVSAMGVDFRDFDNDGHPDLFVTTLSNEGFLLFRNRKGLFDDIADPARVGLASLPFSGWSNLIADFNNDGWKDLFSANGHVLDNIELTQSRTYRQANSLFLNSGDGSFLDVSSDVGDDFRRKAAHRGAALADFDNDGRMDLVVTVLGEPPSLFQNQTIGGGHWLLVRLRGRKSNRDGLGAVLKVELENGQILWNHATTSVGYASSSDPKVHFGLGKSLAMKRMDIQWPSGISQTLENVKADQVLTVMEPDPRTSKGRGSKAAR
ncbi:MAG: FG-GAP-like repeat-containing protein [Acidobacteria bacterium]|nr:FG-GAP-like repeat-containing protein [Acidobacteriota bacterium]MCI0719363.1 FG-GAP-like repeat-containing protein [Acidobacteriota bacterium]